MEQHQKDTGNFILDFFIYIGNMIIFAFTHTIYWDVLDKLTKLVVFISVCISLVFLIKRFAKEFNFKKQ